MSIARKEARESRYWTRIIQASITDSDEWAALQQESEEIARILSAIINSSQRGTQ
jgi:four helix bundle protein